MDRGSHAPEEQQQQQQRQAQRRAWCHRRRWTSAARWWWWWWWWWWGWCSCRRRCDRPGVLRRPRRAVTAPIGRRHRRNDRTTTVAGGRGRSRRLPAPVPVCGWLRCCDHAAPCLARGLRAARQSQDPAGSGVARPLRGRGRHRRGSNTAGGYGCHHQAAALRGEHRRALLAAPRPAVPRRSGCRWA